MLLLKSLPGKPPGSLIFWAWIAHSYSVPCNKSCSFLHWVVSMVWFCCMMGEWTPVLFSNRSNFQHFQPMLFYHNVWHIMLTSSISIQSFQYSLSFFLCLKGRQLQFLMITSGEIWFTFKELFFQPGWLAFIYTLMKHKSSVLNISLPQVDIWNHFKGKGYHIWIWRKLKQVWKG